VNVLFLSEKYSSEVSSVKSLNFLMRSGPELRKLRFKAAPYYLALLLVKVEEVRLNVLLRVCWE
jgi:hypothetical protein